MDKASVADGAAVPFPDDVASAPGLTEAGPVAPPAALARHRDCSTTPPAVPNAPPAMDVHSTRTTHWPRRTPGPL
jgi:hypothetical protein